ncbi:RagB/SusD family nutrient uptake outer membrane protein [Zunongwangia sp. SCSIO 43204]|uniref:RagB/SusD family nutrient uptake outer membrane protein n=1 Tax=Zunongwangia sp. SCSIO 43204 TaxID=2779359 RepID=UPI001CA829F1|nr:RagB/SusD family nutrient uptake outer membrane protein [Zunongwangia sp. SCSIO 43204]UAB84130.1 RagB/SusD family nutrient uptake outer membrane protein [Zunongwangia sp. SCSIO 43204]
MKRYITSLVLCFLFCTSCQDVLEVDPKGVLNEGQITTPEDAEKFVIAAYSQLGNDEINRAFSLWQYGDMRADDAYKGGRDPGDGQGFHFMETFTNVRPDMWEIDGMWFHLYIGVRRANDGLRILQNFTEEEYPQLKTRQAELRFIRGHFYFELKRLFNRIPYIDENVPAADYKLISNVELTSQELWEKITEDFEFAAENLPMVQAQVGRADQIAAYAYLSKTRLYQAFEQNDEYQVTNVNKELLQKSIAAADKVLSSNHGLEPDFANNFLSGSYENGVESLFAVQFSTSDGTANGRLNFGDMLTVPQGLGCCDFKKPSQNLANVFKTDQNGIPYLENFNAENINFDTDNVDPRLDHTIARPGNPWKYETDLIFEEGWSRTPEIYGYYNSLKENVQSDQYENVDPFYGNSKLRIILRYAEVMLNKAEALIELGRKDEALLLINGLRERASNSTEKLVDANGNLLANYKVEHYMPGVNINWSQENARQAVRYERRLEFALEGERFFDLVRWGVAADVLNSYLNVEQSRKDFLQGASFVAGKHEYLPIPQNQIFWSEDRYVQNPGY